MTATEIDLHSCLSCGPARWVNIGSIIYTYDENGHMLTCLRQVWNGQWENATLSTYTYDANGNMLSFLLQTSANGQWTNSHAPHVHLRCEWKNAYRLVKGMDKWCVDEWIALHIHLRCKWKYG